RRCDIVVGRAGLDSTGEDAGIVRAAQDNRHVPLDALWQERLQTALLQQRVAAGQQHAVEIARLDEPQARVRLIDADTDGADDASPSQLVERLEARVHYRLEALLEDGAILDGPEIDVMNQRDVDTCQPESEMRMLERAHDAVVAVVEHRREARQAVLAKIRRLFLAGLHGVQDATNLGR